MNIPDLISDSLETIFWVKDLNSLMRMQIRDPEIFLTLYPGSGMEKIRIRDKHPGSAPLWSTLNFMMKRRPKRLTFLIDLAICARSDKKKLQGKLLNLFSACTGV
jgi:hypothetical protein